MSELYLPSKLVDELAEERALEMMRAQSNPIPFNDSQIRLSTLSGASGNAFEQSQLLREVKGWFAIGAGAVADRIASLSLGAYAKGMDGEDDELLPMRHPANEIIETPNPIFSMPSMLGLAGWWLNLTGQAYWQVIHDGLGVPRELWPMPPDRVFPVPSNGNVIGGYVVVGPNGGEIQLELREVVRIWRPDPKDIYASLGSLSPQAIEFNTDRYRIAHIEQTYKHDATPRLILESGSEEQLPTQTESEAFGIMWRESYHRRRGRDQGVPAMLPPGFKAHELGQTSDGSMTVEMGNQLRDQMLSAMGVPGSIVGLVQDVNRASAETNQYTFDKHGVRPKTKLIAGALTQQLAKQFDSEMVYKFEEFLSPDKDFELLQEESHLRNKVTTINEVRAGHDLEPVPYGDWPVGSFTDVPYTGDEQMGPESVSDLGSAPRVVPTRSNDRAVTDAMRAEASPEKTWQRMIANERRHVSTFARAIAKVFKAQADILIERLHKLLPEPRARVFTDEIFSDGEFDSLYLVDIEALRELIYLSNAKASFGITDPGSTFIFSEVQQQRLRDIGANMVRRVDQNTKNMITRELADGTSKGESVDQLARRIRSSLINRKRARTIARTEVGKAAQLAQLESFVQSAVVEKKQWNTSLDEVVRDSHIAAEGQIVGLEEMFRLGSGSVAMEPLDPSLPPEDLINCRCFMTAVFIEESKGV